MKFNINIKLNVGFLLSLVILAVLWRGRTTKEGYKDTSKEDNRFAKYGKKSYDINKVDPYSNGPGVSNDGEETEGSLAANKVGNAVGGAVDNVGDRLSNLLSNIGALIDTNEYVIKPKWRDSYGSGVDIPDTINMGLKPDTSLIITDGCSKKSILRSDYEEDICTKYYGDNKSIDAKCKALSNDNCNLTDCCILLNGTKCVAGNDQGPSYLTDQGNEIDYYYYLYKNQCYGNGCNDISNNVQDYCSSYAANSTGVSKECMLQIFNDAGCKNPDPKYIINDDYVYNNSKSSRKYIQNDLKNTADSLKSDIIKNIDDSRIKCSADPNNPCDQYLSTNRSISKACMIKMYNDAGCANKTPPLITDQLVLDYNGFDKNTVKTRITEATKLLLTATDTLSQRSCSGQ